MRTLGETERPPELAHKVPLAASIVGQGLANIATGAPPLDFKIPAEITAYLAELDQFIEREIKPLERENDNIRFFDHRREWARTDFERGGLPRHEWEALLAEMRRRADTAGHYRFALPKEYGGKDGSNLAMAIIREHLAAKGLGLHNDLQNESSIVGNLPTVLMFRDFGTKAAEGGIHSEACSTARYASPSA